MRFFDVPSENLSEKTARWRSTWRMKDEVIHRETRKNTQSLTSLKVGHGGERATIGEQGFRGPDATRLVPARENIEFGVDEPPGGYGVIQSGMQKAWLAHGWVREPSSVHHRRAQFIHSNHVWAMPGLRNATHAVFGLSETSHEGSRRVKRRWRVKGRRLCEFKAQGKRHGSSRERKSRPIDHFRKLHPIRWAFSLVVVD